MTSWFSLMAIQFRWKDLMKKTFLWRCSCGAALRTIVEMNESTKGESETAICPACHQLLEVNGAIVELRALDEAAASA